MNTLKKILGRVYRRPAEVTDPVAKPPRSSRFYAEIDDVSEDIHAARLACDFKSGRLDIVQFTSLVLATGRLQGHYMSSWALACEAGLVTRHNEARAAARREREHGR